MLSLSPGFGFYVKGAKSDAKGSDPTFGSTPQIQTQITMLDNQEYGCALAWSVLFYFRHDSMELLGYWLFINSAFPYGWHN